jgi:hypothetical protein
MATPLSPLFELSIRSYDAPESVVTWYSLAGFEGAGSVVTPLAGFAGARRPQEPGSRTAIPAAFR